MFSFRCLRLGLLWLVLSVMMAGCFARFVPPLPEPDVVAEPVMRTAVATADPLLATPMPALAAEPLQGKIPAIPAVLVISAHQSKAALAAYLHTDVEQLQRVNPNLTDPVRPDTLVVIPPDFRLTQASSLAAVVETTGLPEEVLRTANPNLAAGQTELSAGTVLAMPVLYVVPEDTLLSAVADTLRTNHDALLSANPTLAEQEEVMAGTVLVAFPDQETTP